MSTILVIKHGALGDLIQALGVIQDISEHFNQPVDVLSNRAYRELLEALPFVNKVIVDQRSPIYHLSAWQHLRKTFKQQTYTHIYDLQNSKRSTWYRYLFFRHLPFISSRTVLMANETKAQFDQQSVLQRFHHQLTRSGITPKHWQCAPLNALIDREYQAHLALKPYIFLGPFCSAKHPDKRWPHFNALLKRLKVMYPDHHFVIAPGPGEITEARTYNANILLNGDKPTNFRQLISIIAGATYVISNDTGAAHIATHLQRPGLVLMGPKLKQETLGLQHGKMKILQHPSKLAELTIADVLKACQQLEYDHC